MPDTNTLLHVVYAGRGDALIVEYTLTGTNERYFVLIDGGPLFREAFGGRIAPCYKYFQAAALQIWNSDPARTANELSPSAIVCSHPHDDHIAGLLRLLDSLGTSVGKLNFKGPLLIPKFSNDIFQKLKTVLEDNRFEVQDDFDIKGIAIDTNTDNIVAYSIPAQPGFGGGIDASPANKSSILMHLDANNIVGAGDVYSTGDSVGYLINEHVDGKTYPVYKIQHHGSKYNTQAREAVNSANIKVKREMIIPTIFEIALDSISDPTAKEIPTSAAKAMFDLACDIAGFVSCLQKRVYLLLLQSRYRGYVDACKAGITTA